MPDRRSPVRPKAIRRAKRPDPRARAARTKNIGWALAVLGLVLFLSGSLGASLGIVILPFDQHHVIGQFGGIVVAVVGVNVATRDR